MHNCCGQRTIRIVSCRLIILSYYEFKLANIKYTKKLFLRNPMTLQK